jgi:hypothetical protein
VAPLKILRGNEPDEGALVTPFKLINFVDPRKLPKLYGAVSSFAIPSALIDKLDNGKVFI